MKRFPNLRAAGQELALRLADYRGADTVVLGIASGGVPVAHEVANHLGAPFDLVIIRRLFMPEGPGSQACAVSVAGTIVIDDLTPVPLPSHLREFFAAESTRELAARANVCRGDLPPREISGKTILLVDCGIRSGLTMKAAIKSVRERFPKKIVAAVPVASLDGSEFGGAGADGLVSLAFPEPFINAGAWYEDFRRPSDEEVGGLVASSAN